MKITLIPREAEEYAPATDIRTEIESDADYRKRLLTTREGKNRAYSIAGAEGMKLDEVGMEICMIRIHTHICSPLPKVSP